MSAPPTPHHTSTSAGSELLSRSARQTQRIGAQLGALCQSGDLILLVGDLGAGKTALAQGIGRGLGVTAAINSPTFTLLKEYAGRLPLYHLDLYRLDGPAAVAEVGIDDYLEGEGVCVVEWAERAEALWPPSWLRIQLTATGSHERQLRLEACGARGQQLRDALLRTVGRRTGKEAP